MQPNAQGLNKQKHANFGVIVRKGCCFDLSILR